MPTRPTSATSVKTYGSALTSVAFTPAAVCSALPSALANPNSSAAHSTPHGRQLPNTTAARAMKPRPAVMFSLNDEPKPNDRNAPAMPASMPLATTAR